jgi:TAG lipase/lysophosphatidylethanolamine acyltransferase
VPWATAQGITFRPWRQASYPDRHSPLSRIAELFNVNHFIVSQARPYIAPFLRSDLEHRPPTAGHAVAGGSWNLTAPLLRLLALELHHRLNQLDALGVLPAPVRRLLIDESIHGPSLTLVPELAPADLLRLLEHPTHERLQYWILRGERSVWPAVGALKVRCAVEVELDRGYQVVRRRKPLDVGMGVAVQRRRSSVEGKKRRRAVSVGLG